MADLKIAIKKLRASRRFTVSFSSSFEPSTKVEEREDGMNFHLSSSAASPSQSPMVSPFNSPLPSPTASPLASPGRAMRRPSEDKKDGSKTPGTVRRDRFPRLFRKQSSSPLMDRPKPKLPPKSPSFSLTAEDLGAESDDETKKRKKMRENEKKETEVEKIRKSNRESLSLEKDTSGDKSWGEDFSGSLTERSSDKSEETETDPRKRGGVPEDEGYYYTVDQDEWINEKRKRIERSVKLLPLVGTDEPQEGRRRFLIEGMLQTKRLIIPQELNEEDFPSYEWLERTDVHTKLVNQLSESYQLDTGCAIFELPQGKSSHFSSAYLYLLDPHSDIAFYQEYLVGREQLNLLGEDTILGPVIISIEDKFTQSSKKKLRIIRAVIRHQKGSKKAVIPLASGQNQRDVLKLMKNLFPKVGQMKLKLVKSPQLQFDLIKLENDEIVKNYKFGILYCKKGQTSEEQMLANDVGNEDFEEFLSFLGQRITLLGWTSFRGGLDVKNNTTGEKSLFAVFRGYPIMFHVAPFLPNNPSDTQKIDRKRHLGNDIVVIVFMEGIEEEDNPSSLGEPLLPNVLQSDVNYVYIFIKKYSPRENSSGSTYYRMNIACKAGVPAFGPLLPDPPIFEKNQQFRELFFSKCINSERASMKSQAYSEKISRSRREFLLALVQKYLQAN